ncbi:MAG: amino acid-binding protein [Bacteroidales bacterium]
MIIKQVSVFLENRSGRLNEVTRILGKNNVNMVAFSMAENPEFGILRMIVDDCGKAEKALREAKFGVSLNDVVSLSIPNVSGSLAHVLEVLAAEDIFIEYMYAFAKEDAANNAVIVIRPTFVDKCEAVLNKNGL